MDARVHHNVEAILTGKDASLSTLIIVARELRTKGDFAKAEDLYSRALAKLESQPTESPHKLLEVLAGRASVREQAGRLEEALQDANRILKVVPKHPRGYFILGGLLEKKKKFKSALKCYDYGISKCPQTHEAFSDLVKAARDLRALLSDNEANKHRKNFFPEFPPEIISMITTHLTVKDILRCHRVSPQWRTILSSDPTLYSDIDFVSIACRLRTESVKALIQHSWGRIRTLRMLRPELTFSPTCFRCDDQAAVLGVKNVSNAHLRPLFQGLEKLEIRESDTTTPLGLISRGKRKNLFLIPGFPSQNLRSLHLEYHLGMENVITICVAAPQLESFSCIYYQETSAPMEGTKVFPSVTELAIQTQMGGTWSFIYPLLQWFPNVDAFAYNPVVRLPLAAISELRDVTFQNPNLKSLRISPQGCRSLEVRSENLRVLSVTASPTLASLHIPVQRSLEELTISELPMLAPTCLHHCGVNFLERIHPSAVTLRKLTIRYAPKFEVKDIEHFLRNAKGLEYLMLRSVKYVSDATLEWLWACKRLEMLYVDDCTGITGVGLIRLIKEIGKGAGGRLKSVSTIGNESIRRQTVDWARGIGVIIDI